VTNQIANVILLRQTDTSWTLCNFQALLNKLVTRLGGADAPRAECTLLPMPLAAVHVKVMKRQKSANADVYIYNW